MVIWDFCWFCYWCRSVAVCGKIEREISSLLNSMHGKMLDMIVKVRMKNLSSLSSRVVRKLLLVKEKLENMETGQGKPGKSSLGFCSRGKVFFYPAVSLSSRRKLLIKEKTCQGEKLESILFKEKSRSRGKVIEKS